MTKVFPRTNESIQQTTRRFKKLVEREGLIKDMRKKEYYEKPSEIKNRQRRKKIREREKIEQAAKYPQKHNKQKQK